MSKFFPQPDNDEQNYQQQDDWFPQQQKKKLLLSYLLNQQTNNKKINKIKKKYKSYLQMQNQERPFVYLQQNMHCEYYKWLCQFVCCNNKCLKHAFICGRQFCQCQKLHKNCKIVLTQKFFPLFETKLNQPINDGAYRYFEGKKYLFQHMMNIISQERQVIRQSFEDQQKNKKHLLIYRSDPQYFQIEKITCNQPKVIYSNPKMISLHKDCGCTKKRIQIKSNEMFKLINKIYSIIIEQFDEVMEAIEEQKQFINLNVAQTTLMRYLKKSLDLWDEQKTPGQNAQISGSLISKIIQYIKVQKNNFNVQIQLIRIRWVKSTANFFNKLVDEIKRNIIDCIQKSKNIQNLNTISTQIKNCFHLIRQQFKQNQQRMQEKILNLQKSQKYKQIKKLCNLLQKYEILFQVFIIQDQKFKNYQQVIKFSQTSFFSQNQKIRLNNKLCRFLQYQIENCPNTFRMVFKNNKINKLSVQNCKKFKNEQFLIQFCQVYPNIKFLQIKNGNFSIDQNLFFANKLKRLQNMTIDELTGSNFVQLIQKIPNIKDLSLQYEVNGQKRAFRNKIPVKAQGLETLQNKNHLQILKLKSIPELSIFHRVFRSSCDLQKLQIRYCISLANQTLEIISKNCVNLKELSIQNNISLTGNHLCNFDNLLSLQLKYCHQIKSQIAQKAIQNLKKIKKLEVQSNVWVTDKLLLKISLNCQNLQQLNISSCSNITGIGLTLLKKLIRLKKLNCGNTKISGKSIIALTQSCVLIQNLSIMNLNGKNQNFGIVQDYELQRISQNIRLIELDIHGCHQFTKKCIDQLFHLKKIYWQKKYKIKG